MGRGKWALQAAGTPKGGEVKPPGHHADAPLLCVRGTGGEGWGRSGPLWRKLGAGNLCPVLPGRQSWDLAATPQHTAFHSLRGYPSSPSHHVAPKMV